MGVSLAELERRAKEKPDSYNSAGEPYTSSQTVINKCLVHYENRMGNKPFYRITDMDSHISEFHSHEEAQAFLDSKSLPWTHR